MEEARTHCGCIDRDRRREAEELMRVGLLVLASHIQERPWFEVTYDRCDTDENDRGVVDHVAENTLAQGEVGLVLNNDVPPTY
jgi:hypothetical protein